MDTFRLLVLSNYYPPVQVGGWEQLTREMVELLRKRGHTVRVLTSNQESEHLTPQTPDVVRKLTLDSPNHAHYRPTSTLMDRWNQWMNRRHLTKVVEEFAPDVVFVNGMWNLSVNVAQAAEKLCPARVCYYFASPWPTELDAHRAYWRMAARRGVLVRPKRFMGRFAERLLASAPERNQLDFKKVLCVSEYMQHYAQTEVGVPKDRTAVVFNGTDVEKFSPCRSVNGNGRSLKLIYAGGLWRHKGVHTAVEAMDVLVNRLSVPGVSLTLVGDGHPDYVCSLREQVARFGIQDCVFFREKVDRSSMPQLLQKFDALVFPSVWAEPLARMVQEAMACGLVVLGTPTGGTPEILKDGENGIVFGANQPKQLAGSIQTLVENPPLRVRLGKAARQTVEKNFTLGRMAKELEHHLRQLAG